MQIAFKAVPGLFVKCSHPIDSYKITKLCCHGAGELSPLLSRLWAVFSFSLLLKKDEEMVATGFLFVHLPLLPRKLMGSRHFPMNSSDLQVLAF